MLYVSVGDAVPADDSFSTGSDSSALLPSELVQHLDTYDGSLGCLSLFASHSLLSCTTPVVAEARDRNRSIELNTEMGLSI